MCTSCQKVVRVKWRCSDLSSSLSGNRSRIERTDRSVRSQLQLFAGSVQCCLKYLCALKTAPKKNHFDHNFHFCASALRDVLCHTTQHHGVTRREVSSGWWQMLRQNRPLPTSSRPVSMMAAVAVIESSPSVTRLSSICDADASRAAAAARSFCSLRALH